MPTSIYALNYSELFFIKLVISLRVWLQNLM
jgi:hypothetical protein